MKPLEHCHRYCGVQSAHAGRRGAPLPSERRSNALAPPMGVAAAAFQLIMITQLIWCTFTILYVSAYMFGSDIATHY
eukprot:SAG11_NODE_19996_length_454_cov_3.087324_1_plen_76_part_01